MNKKKHNTKKVTKHYKLLFYKEVIFTILALMSVFLLAYEYIAQPSQEIVTIIMRFDFAVAMIFLTDFIIHLYAAKDKKLYWKYNWYFLLASIPIVDSWAEVLRALRILGLVRLLRAAEHVKYSTTIYKNQ